MPRYQTAIQTSQPERMPELQPQPGQWIRYDGVTGRYMGERGGTIWIAWSATARKRDRWQKFAAAYKRGLI